MANRRSARRMDRGSTPKGSRSGRLLTERWQQEACMVAPQDRRRTTAMVQRSGRNAQPATPARPDRVGLGIATIVAAVAAMSFQDGMVKYVSAGMPLWQIYVLRSLLALPILLALLRFRRRPLPIRPTSPGWAFLRSLLLVTSYIAFYASLPLLSLSVAAAAVYTAPLFITLLSALWLRDPVGPWR